MFSCEMGDCCEYLYPGFKQRNNASLAVPAIARLASICAPGDASELRFRNEWLRVGLGMTTSTPQTHDLSNASGAASHAHTDTAPIPITRRRIDLILIGIGLIVVVVLATSAGLLRWGSSFSNNYVHDELSSQNISFNDEASLRKEGRTDLVKYAGQTLDSGQKAQAYASYIDGHLTKIGAGKTFADLGAPETAAKDAVKTAVAANASTTEIAQLQSDADAISATRNTVFKGETLRGLLLSAYAWSTVGRIAGIAALGAALAAIAMAVLVILGFVHVRRNQATTMAH